MGYFKAGKDKEHQVVNKETVQEILEYPFVEARDRKVSKAICEKFGIRAALSEKDGKTVEAYYFPSYDQKGKIVGFTKQDVTKHKTEKGHWSTVGSVTIGNKLFGQNVAEEVQRKKNVIVVTEGQWDCVSSFQALVDNVKGTKYEGLEPFVVSIPMGTGNAVEALLHNESFIQKYDGLCLFFDNDHSTPAELKKGILKGKEAREAVASAFIGAGLSITTVIAEGEYKDASDYLQDGESESLAKLIQFGKQVYAAEKIVRASEIDLEELLTPQKPGFMVKCFPKLMKGLNGLRESELTLFLAPSNVGKTTVCSILGAEIMDDFHLGMIYLEEDKRETFLRQIASKLKVNYLKFKENPLSVASREEIQAVYDDIAQNNKLAIVDHFGSMPVDGLMNKIKHLHLVEGCRFIILDHISMVVSGTETDNERKELDIVMTALASFCAANPVHVLVISHINRTNAQQFLPPKGSEGEPFWVNVTKESARGSSALEACSWNIVALEPEVMPDFSRGRVRFKILKTRFGNFLGIADVFTLDKETWQPILEEDTTQNF